MSAQVPDKILFSDEFRNLYSNPLELYWNNTKRKRPEFTTSEECSRGYVAYWTIKKNQLFLERVEGEFRKRFLFFGRRMVKYTVNTLFPRSKNRIIKAGWFSGKLRIPDGKMTIFEDEGYDSRFEREIIITIDKGDVLKTVTLDYTQKKLIVISE